MYVKSTSSLIPSSSVPDSFTIGPSQVSSEAVEAVCTALFKQLGDFTHIAREEYKKNKDFYDRTGYAPHADLKELGNSSASIPKPQSESRLIIPPESDNNEDETRYNARLLYDLNQLDTSEPIGSLLISLSESITELGVPCNPTTRIDLRYSRGFVDKNSISWHYDEPQHMTAITVSFSNRTDWTTRVIDEHSKKEIAPGRTYINNESGLNEALDLKAQATTPGYFYNATKTFHRIPIAADFEAQPIQADDWRIFVRFFT